MSGAARRRPRAPRDQAESAFAPILADLVDRLPGARAAALVDVDGETVDYATCPDPFAVRLAAAHLRIALREAQAAAGDDCAVSVRGSRGSYFVRALPHGYALVVVLTCGAMNVSSTRVLPICVQRLAREAGWGPTRAAGWHTVEVDTDGRGRPLALRTGASPAPLSIVGAIASGLARFERGWRVRLGGVEATLIREAGGHWYVDEPLSSGPGVIASEQAPTLAHESR